MANEPAPLDAPTVQAALRSASSVRAAAQKLKTSEKRLRNRCREDDALRPLFYELLDRGKAKSRGGMPRMRIGEGGL